MPWKWSFKYKDMFEGKKVLILGYGLEGKASFHYLKKHSPESISIADTSTKLIIEEEVRDHISNLHLGESWLDGVAEADVIIRSPGIAPELIYKQSGKRKNLLITSATELFLKKHSKKTIGITGTKGKSTTSSLLQEVIRSSGLNAMLLGNIGKPALALIEEEPDYFIYELSSYQLQDLTISPHVAVFLNFYQEHLDHHGSIEKYFSAKAKIFEFQSPDDYLIVSRDVYKKTRANIFSEVVVYDGKSSNFFIEDTSIQNTDVNIPDFKFEISQSKLRGMGNLNNILAVLTVSQLLNLNLQTTISAVNDFKPLAHRLEILGEKNKITFVNDSISTVPQATINALDAFSGDVRILVAGGYDRGVDFSELAEEIIRSKISLLLLFRPSGERIYSSLKNKAVDTTEDLPKVKFIESLDEIVNFLSEFDGAPGVCLLSPASPSFGKFKNFEDRGECFRKVFFEI